MTTFAKWTHPKTGELRVYVNGLPRASFAKVYIKPGRIRPDGQADWDVSIWADRGALNATRDELVDSIDFALKEINGGELVFTFDRVCELAH